MKKTALLFIATLIFSQAYSQIYISKECEISFFSTTPIEDITAVNKKTMPFLNAKTGAIQMKISITGFVFEKPLMQEHFNENYLESEKYPYAIFKGIINEKIDYSKDGKHKVTVTGMLNIHNVEKERTMTGVLEIAGDKIIIASSFKVNFEEHAVKIPALYSGVFPPDTDVKIDATFLPFKKK